jgi:hypothetical protein
MSKVGVMSLSVPSDFFRYQVQVSQSGMACEVPARGEVHRRDPLHTPWTILYILEAASLTFEDAILADSCYGALREPSQSRPREILNPAGYGQRLRLSS